MKRAEIIEILEKYKSLGAWDRGLNAPTVLLKQDLAYIELQVASVARALKRYGFCDERYWNLVSRASVAIESSRGTCFWPGLTDYYLQNRVDGSIFNDGVDHIRKAQVGDYLVASFQGEITKWEVVANTGTHISYVCVGNPEDRRDAIIERLDPALQVIAAQS